LSFEILSIVGARVDLSSNVDVISHHDNQHVMWWYSVSICNEAGVILIIAVVTMLIGVTVEISIGI